MRLNQMLILCLLFFTISCISAESRPYYKLTLSNGNNYEGTILKEKPDGSILFRTKDGVKYLLHKDEISSLTEMAIPFAQTNKIQNLGIPYKGNFGVGIGIPYGIFGFGADYFVRPRIAATIGLGTAFIGGAYDVGIRYFLRDMDHTWRPRLSAYYGINSFELVQTADNELDKKNSDTFAGLTLGIGQQWSWGKSKHTGIELDMNYLVTTGVFDRIDELKAHGYDVSEASRIQMSIGIRHNF